MGKGAVQFVVLSIIVLMMVGSLPNVIYFVALCNNSRVSYLSDKTVIDENNLFTFEKEGPILSVDREGSFVINGAQLISTFLVADKFVSEGSSVSILGSTKFDMSNNDYVSRKYDEFPGLMTSIKLNTIDYNKDYIFIWDEQNKLWNVREYIK